MRGYFGIGSCGVLRFGQQKSGQVGAVGAQGVGGDWRYLFCAAVRELVAMLGCAHEQAYAGMKYRGAMDV